MARVDFSMRRAWRALPSLPGLLLLAACGGQGTLVAGGRTGGTGISTGAITATRIDSTGPIDADDHIVQALVGPFDAVARTLTLLGITVDASGAGVEFRDDRDDLEDLPLTAAQFFAALTEGETIVKARGTPAGDPITSLIADQVELE